MSSPPEDSPDPHAAPERGPGVVLVCQSCDHTWEPSLADLAAGTVPCTHCDGWTMIGELAEPDPATSRPQRTSLDSRSRTGQIPSSWLQITGVISDSELLALREKVTERDIDPHDLGAVRAVWEQPEPTVIATRYTVSIIAPEDPSARHFTITVERRAPTHQGGPWTWAVCHDGYSLTTDGHWEPELPGPRSATQRYAQLDSAVRLATQWAPRIGTIDYTAAQWLTRNA
ncbi:MAG: hypothetical protein ACRDRF_03800 [Pseudonocardiaceae bacterium]